MSQAAAAFTLAAIDILEAFEEDGGYAQRKPDITLSANRIQPELQKSMTFAEIEVATTLAIGAARCHPTISGAVTYLEMVNRVAKESR